MAVVENDGVADETGAFIPADSSVFRRFQNFFPQLTKILTLDALVDGYFSIPSSLSILACTTRGGFNDAQGFLPLLLCSLVWNGLDVARALFSLPKFYSDAKKSILHPNIKWAMFITIAIYFGFILPMATLLALISSSKAAHEKGVPVILNSNDTLGSPLTLAFSNFAFGGGLLLNAMIEAYSFFRARYKLTMQDDQYNLYTEYLLKHRKTCNFDDAQPSLAMQTRREKWVIASINSVSSRDSELLPHQIEKIEQNFIAFAADVIGFLGAMFGGTSMLLDDDTGRRLAMVTASCYILSSLARLFKLSATVMSSSQDNYKKLISTLFVLPSMIKDHGPRIINSLNQE